MALSEQRHRELGTTLQRTNEMLTGLYVELAGAYPRNSPAAVRAKAVSKALNELRSVLDDQVFQDLPHLPEEGLLRLYYGS